MWITFLSLSWIRYNLITKLSSQCMFLKQGFKNQNPLNKFIVDLVDKSIKYIHFGIKSYKENLWIFTYMVLFIIDIFCHRFIAHLIVIIFNFVPFLIGFFTLDYRVQNFFIYPIISFIFHKNTSLRYKRDNFQSQIEIISIIISIIIY